MAKPSALHSSSLVDTIITMQDFQQGFKKLSNRTSLSPSGRHITHYKILATGPELSQILARAITLPFTYRFSPAGWRIAIQFMLEKEPGNPIISKLRVIQLLEADMNFAFWLLWGKRLVHNTMAHSVISPWNLGGHPGARVHSALLLKTISNDYLCFTQHNAIIFDSNTKACFDRIIPSLGLMATEHLGMPQQATASTLATIKGMHFFIHTAHGISPSFYTSTAATLVLGVLQQSRAAPCIWISLSYILLQALQSHTTGFQVSCPCNTRISQCPGEAYVDNTDLWVTGISPSTPSMTLTSSMQRIAQVWDCLLFASRGALALQKWFYCLVQWWWTPHGFPVMSRTTNSPTTVLQMISGRTTFPTLIPRVETSTGRRTLGVRLVLDGSFSKELAHRQDQALTWVHNIRAYPLIRDKVYMAYCSMWRTSFEYPLPITCFTKQ